MIFLISDERQKGKEEEKKSPDQGRVSWEGEQLDYTATYLPPQHPSNLVLGLLGSLRSQLHHQEHQSVDTKYENNNKAGTPPPKVFLCEVQRPEIVSTGGILANTAIVIRAGVEQICSYPHALLVGSKVFTTGLVGWWVEQGDLIRSTSDRFGPRGKSKQRAHEIIERVDIVHPAVSAVRNHQ